MQRKFLTILFIPLVAALTAQAAAASEHHHMRAKNRGVISEQVRNSNAYAVPADVPTQTDLSDYANGAMASGIAGH
ncbi:MAG TPA: hypothetical protein VK834_04625 [Bradyrhizobium sp.]|nr:hypothetical protein [Bradyrhizobium sp.]